MTLAFSASQFLWKSFGRSPVSFEEDENQIEELKSFVNALHLSHGYKECASEQQISKWCSSQKNSFFLMLKQVLAELEEQVSLATIDLVVLAHWTHDTVIGHSVTNAVLHEIGASNAFGIAISDHGISSSWFALSLIDDFLSESKEHFVERTALLLIADQSTALHNSLHLENVSAVSCAGAILLKKCSQGVDVDLKNVVLFKGYNKYLKSLNLNDITNHVRGFFSAIENELPLVILTTKKMRVLLESAGLFENEKIILWDESLMSLAPWASFGKCPAPSTRYIFLSDDDESIITAGFISGE